MPYSHHARYILANFVAKFCIIINCFLNIKHKLPFKIFFFDVILQVKLFIKDKFHIILSLILKQRSSIFNISYLSKNTADRSKHTFYFFLFIKNDAFEVSKHSIGDAIIKPLGYWWALENGDKLSSLFITAFTVHKEWIECHDSSKQSFLLWVLKFTFHVIYFIIFIPYEVTIVFQF